MNLVENFIKPSSNTIDLEVGGETDRLNHLAWNLRESNFPEALHLAKQAHTHAEAIGYPLGLAWSLRTEGYCHTQSSAYDQALHCLAAARSLFQQLRLPLEEARCLTLLGRIYQWLHNYFEAISHYQACLAMELLPPHEKSDTLDLLGFAYLMIGEQSQAAAAYLQSLALREQLHDSKRIGASLTSLGLVHEETGNYEEALNYFTKSAQLLQNDPESQLTYLVALGNIGNIHEQMANFSEALYYYQQCFDLCEPNYKQSIAIKGLMLDSIGDVYRKMGAATQALTYYQAALQLFRDNGQDGHELINVLLSLGTFYTPDQPKLALPYLSEALQLAEAQQLKNLFTQLHEQLATVYEALGDYRLALAHQRKFQHHQQRVEQLKTQQLIARHEVSKAQQESTFLTQLNYELEAQVASRTTELTQAFTELKRLDHLKDDFLSTISHELRTPLSNMKLAIIMLKNTPLEDQAKYLQILESECQREIQLVNKLLQLQRVNTTPQVWEQILLTPWLLTLLQPLQAKAIKQKQSLWWHLPNSDYTIISEPTSVEQILVELVNNALKFTPFGGEIHVTIQLTDLSWRIQVTNTEVEVPQVEVERIFDRFYRIPNNDPWKTSGTGLGLTLVQKLVERLGGTVTAQSHLKSFAVVVTLPNNPYTAVAQGTDKNSLE